MFDSKYDKYLKILIILTGAIHLLAGVGTMGKDLFLGVILLLNGFGFFALLLGIYYPLKVPVLGMAQKSLLKGMNKQLRMGLMLYTVATIIAYFVVFGAEGFTLPLGIITKVIEVVIVILLLL